ncbi:MAG: hypothetical protein V1809_04390 [Planctomycetota bacterium]
MAKPNYAFAKRQRDIAKKRKHEEKLRRKMGTVETPPPAISPLPLPPSPPLSLPSVVPAVPVAPTTPTAPGI